MRFLTWLFPRRSLEANRLAGDAKSTYDVFISYSSPDKKLAHAACAVLEARRIRCWIAPRDIAPGTEWGASIIDGIDSCRIMVLIFSNHANESVQVRREVERAISKGLILLPVRVQDALPAGAMEYALSNTHWLDAFTPPVEAHLETLAASVQGLLTTHVSKIGGDAAPDRAVKLRATESANSKRTAIPNAAERAVVLVDLGYTLYAFGLAQQTLGDSDVERGMRELGDLFDRLGITLPQSVAAHEMFKTTRRGLLSDQERECLDVGLSLGDVYGIGTVMIVHKGTDYENQARKALSKRANELQVSLQSLGILDGIERKEDLFKILFPIESESSESFSQRLDLLKASVKAELRRQLRDV